MPEELKVYGDRSPDRRKKKDKNRSSHRVGVTPRDTSTSGGYRAPLFTGARGAKYDRTGEQQWLEDRSPDRVKTQGCGRLPSAPHSDTGRPLTLSTAIGPGLVCESTLSGNAGMEPRNSEASRKTRSSTWTQTYGATDHGAAEGCSRDERCVTTTIPMREMGRSGQAVVKG